MVHAPSAEAMCASVAEHLRSDILPQLPGYSIFQARVAANMLAIVSRELAIWPQAMEQEIRELSVILGTEGHHESLVELLCERLVSEPDPFHDPAIIAYLWRSTLTRMSIDQPEYPAYRREIGFASAK